MADNEPTSTNPFDDEIDRRQVPALKVHPMVLGENSKNLFAAGVADMDFRAPPVVIEALAARLAHGVFGYETLSKGLIPALIDWQQKQHNWQIEPEQILRAPNVLNALAIAASLFTDEGDAIIVQPPVFFDFFDVVTENHRTIAENPLVLKNGRYWMDFDNLEQIAANPRTKMLFLCNPHNPVGRVWTKQELQTLGDICSAHNVIIVSDEIHADLVFPGHKYTPFASLGHKYAQNTITCLSPAKTFNIPACSAAFTIITDPLKRKAFQIENSRLTVNKNNAFTNTAMEAAYKHAKPWLADAIEYITKNLNLVRSTLDEIPNVDLIEPEGTFLLWLNFEKSGLQGDALTNFLRQKAHWATTRGHAFGKQGNSFTRLNIACTHKKLEIALQQLKSVMK